MSNSIFVHVLRVPADLKEIENIIGSAFSDFGLPAPDVQLHVPPDGRLRSIRDSIITVAGSDEHDHCWISFNDFPTEVAGKETVIQMCGVTTRGSWLFAGIVAVALFGLGGPVAYNDSCELDGQEEYDESALRQVIRNALAAGEKYLKQ